MHEYLFQVLNFTLLYAIFAICSFIYFSSKEKYDVVASTLFLNRNILKKPIFTGYVGIILLFAGNFLSIMRFEPISGKIVQYLVIVGLSLILFMVLKIHLAINANRKFNEELKKKINQRLEFSEKTEDQRGLFLI